MSSGTEFLDRFYTLLGSDDVEGVVELFADDGEVIRYDGVADTSDEIAKYFRGHLDRHPGFALLSFDEVLEVDDVLMWNALVDTDNGILQTVHVVVFTEDGSVHRLIPGHRGYWGK